MTSLSEYLRAERFDTSEPAGFYVPGADDWQIGRAPSCSRAYLRWRIRREEQGDLPDLDEWDDPVTQ